MRSGRLRESTGMPMVSQSATSASHAIHFPCRFFCESAMPRIDIRTELVSA